MEKVEEKRSYTAHHVLHYYYYDRVYQAFIVEKTWICGKCGTFFVDKNYLYRFRMFNGDKRICHRRSNAKNIENSESNVGEITGKSRCN